MIHWFRERLREPSTHLALSCFLGFSGIALDSASLEPSEFSEVLLTAGAVFAFLGLIGKDRQGPLL